jgi:hypothetical protein
MVGSKDWNIGFGTESKDWNIGFGMGSKEWNIVLGTGSRDYSMGMSSILLLLVALVVLQGLQDLVWEDMGVEREYRL